MNILKVVLPKLINSSQVGFLSDRNITDAAWIANKCLDSRTKIGKLGILENWILRKHLDHVNGKFKLDLLR